LESTLRTAALRLTALAASLVVQGCASAPPGTVPAVFDCDDGAKLRLVFDHPHDMVHLMLDRKTVVDVPSRDPEAGIWYAGAGYELRGAGDTLKFSAPGHETTRCVQAR
jgi:hypothetical protein